LPAAALAAGADHSSTAHVCPRRRFFCRASRKKQKRRVMFNDKNVKRELQDKSSFSQT
jgi:hypothetical protein